MTTTFSELISLSANVTATGTGRLANNLRANVTAYGTSYSGLDLISGGVTYRSLYSNASAVTSSTATLGVLRSLSASVTATGTGYQGVGVTVTLPAVEALSGDLPLGVTYGEASITLPVITSTSNDPLPVPGYALSATSFPPLTTVATSLTGEVATVSITLPSLATLSSAYLTAHPGYRYAQSTAVLPAVRSLANDEQTAFGIYDREFVFSFDDYSAAVDYSAGYDEVWSTTDSLTPSQIIDAAITTLMRTTDGYIGNGEYGVVMSEVMQTLDGLVKQDAQIVWVYNTESQANSTYRGWNFNSAGAWQQSYYAASEDGLYELTGDDDAGTPIVGSILTGTSDLGTVQQKRLAYVYVGATADGGLDLVVHTDDGQTNTYSISSRELLMNSRTAIGKGLRSKYWQFELTNPDGSDFEIESIEPIPAATIRRI